MDTQNAKNNCIMQKYTYVYREMLHEQLYYLYKNKNTNMGSYIARLINFN